MARDAAHQNFVHTLETFAAWLKADQALPVPTEQTIIHVRVAGNEAVIEFAGTQGLPEPTRTKNNWLYVDVPFGAIIYRVASGSW